MNIIAGPGEYILQTYNTTFFEDSMGVGLNPPNLPPRGTPVVRGQKEPTNLKKKYINMLAFTTFFSWKM